MQALHWAEAVRGVAGWYTSRATVYARWSIHKKQGYYETQNIYRYIRFKLHEYQSSEVGCNDCKMAGIF
jgi:hypothetical protein